MYVIHSTYFWRQYLINCCCAAAADSREVVDDTSWGEMSCVKVMEEEGPGSHQHKDDSPVAAGYVPEEKARCHITQVFVSSFFLQIWMCSHIDILPKFSFSWSWNFSTGLGHIWGTHLSAAGYHCNSSCCSNHQLSQSRWCINSGKVPLPSPKCQMRFKADICNFNTFYIISGVKRLNDKKFKVRIHI